MYNFSNGSLIQDIKCDGTGPISSAMVIEKEEKGSKAGTETKEFFLITAGWNGAVWVSRLRDVRVSKISQ